MKFVATVVLLSLAAFGLYSLLRLFMRKIGTRVHTDHSSELLDEQLSDEERNARILNLLFRLAGRLCKCDGPVVREEIASLEKFLGTLSGLSEKARSVAIEEFRSGKERATSYEKIRNDAFDLYWLHRGRRNSLGEIFRLYLRVAMSDGALNESEEVVLEMISQGFGLGLKETTLIKNSVIREFWSEHKEYYRKASEERKKTEQRLADQARAWIRSSDFTALGLTPEASLDQIKRAYRRLVKECHPDMLQQRGTLNHDQKEAARRFHEIQTAYDRLIAIKSSAKAA